MKKEITTVVGYSYTCNILGKQIEPDEVFAEFPDNCIVSKEAASRLPNDFCKPQLLEALARCFLFYYTNPEDLGRGVWLWCIGSYLKNHHHNNINKKFLTLEEAREYIFNCYTQGDYHLFEEGKYIETTTIKLVQTKQVDIKNIFEVDQPTILDCM